MSATKLQAELREVFGKGAARKIRRAGKVPAVIYGHGMDPVHVSLDGHDVFLATKTANALLDIAVSDGSKHLVLVKSVQRCPIKLFAEHVDLIAVRRGEMMEVEVPIHTVGEAHRSALVTVELSMLTIKAEATAVPEALEVSIEGLEAGTIITAGEIPLPKGCELACDPELTIVHVADVKAASSSVDDEEEAAAAE